MDHLSNVKRPRALHGTLLSLILLSGACGGDGLTLQTKTLKDEATDAEGGAPSTPENPCEDAEAGAACGPGRVCRERACVESLCGDGVKALEEECDDGNQNTGDGCTPSCKNRPLTCGDAVLDQGEECDDGNWFDLDACSNDCTNNLCGNARDDALEECDDGNQVNDDGCSNQCTENRCRNGRLDPGEECDDGNRDHEDGCNNGCLIIACGDGKVDGPLRGGSEECDDGNAVDSDGCANACTKNECGNARVDPGEVCDGSTSQYVCANNCREKASNGACDACLQQHCTNFMDSGLDLVASCTASEDPEFRAQCRAVVDCAQTNRCGYGPSGAPECFCGTADLNACQQAGAANGPCQSQWYAAARTNSLAVLIGSFSDIALPSGMAYYLIECQRDHCKSECTR